MSYETAATISFDALQGHPDIAQLQQTYGAVLTELTIGSPFIAPTTQPPRHEQVFQTVKGQTIDSDEALAGRSLEDGEDDAWVDGQEYSHSTRMIGVVGRLAVQGLIETQEGQIAKESLRERFESSVIEMLHTDQEFRDKLEINRERQYVIRGGHVMAMDGKTTMVGITGRGARLAAKEAEADEAMRPIAARCAADERVAERVDALPVGGCIVGYFP